MGDLLLPLPDIEAVIEWVDLPEVDHGRGVLPARRVRTFRVGAWAIVPMCIECTDVTVECWHRPGNASHQVEHIETRLKGCPGYSVRFLMHLVVALDAMVTCPATIPPRTGFAAQAKAAREMAHAMHACEAGGVKRRSLVDLNAELRETREAHRG